MMTDNHGAATAQTTDAAGPPALAGYTVDDPVCDECNVPLNRYGPAIDTGRMGWSCDLCGWSWDDDEDS